VNAHFTICVLSYFINRIICMKLHQNKGKVSKDFITHQSVYKALSDGTIDNIRINNASIQGYKLSGINDCIKEIVNRLKMPGIIKFKPTMDGK